MPLKRVPANLDTAETIDIESRLAPFFERGRRSDAPTRERHSPEQGSVRTKARTAGSLPRATRPLPTPLTAGSGGPAQYDRLRASGAGHQHRHHRTPPPQGQLVLRRVAEMVEVVRRLYR